MKSLQWENWNHLFCRKVSFLTAPHCQIWFACQGIELSVSVVSFISSSMGLLLSIIHVPLTYNICSCCSICVFCMLCRSLFVLFLLVIVLSVLWFTASEYPFGIFWPLYCISFFDLRLLVTSLVYFGHCIVCPLNYDFWLPLWYLLAIVLSVLWITTSQYPFGIFWPLYCISFFDLRLLVTSLVSFGRCIVRFGLSCLGGTLVFLLSKTNNLSFPSFYFEHYECYSRNALCPLNLISTFYNYSYTYVYQTVYCVSTLYICISHVFKTAPVQAL